MKSRAAHDVDEDGGRGGWMALQGVVKKGEGEGSDEGRVAPTSKYHLI